MGELPTLVQYVTTRNIIGTTQVFNLVKPIWPDQGLNYHVATS